MPSRKARVEALVAGADSTACAGLALGFLATWADVAEMAQAERPCDLNEADARRGAQLFEAAVGCCEAALPGGICYPYRFEAVPDA